MKGTISVLGAGGAVGKTASLALINKGYNVRLLCRNNPGAILDALADAKIPKDVIDRVQIVSKELPYDGDASGILSELCEGTDMIIGCVGPSVRYSRMMLEYALSRNIPYLDPGGMHLIKESENMGAINSYSAVGAGVFPGLSGWIAVHVQKLFASKFGEPTKDGRLEICVGGVYRFSKAAAVDFVTEGKDSKAGVPMACIRSKEIVPAQSASPGYIPSILRGYNYMPYLSEEFMYLGTRKVSNLDSYTVMDDKLKNIMFTGAPTSEQLTGLDYEDESCLITASFYDKDKRVTVCFEAADPGMVTGSVLAVSADSLMENRDRYVGKRGIFPLYELVEDVPMISELEKIIGSNMTVRVEYSD